MPLVTPEERELISRVILRFYWLVDHGRASESAACFSDSASIVYGPGTPKPGTVQGAAIRKMLVAREQQSLVTTRHVLTNITLDKNSDGSAAAHSILTMYRSEGEHRDSYPAAIADIEECLVLAPPNGWLIQKRTIMPIFAMPKRENP